LGTVGRQHHGGRRGVSRYRQRLDLH
jgi:hypothetical protein